MYEGDTPNAERRAAALSLDRDLLRELLGQEELRDLIDADALAEVEADLQHLSERMQAANTDSLHDVLRALGDLTRDRGAGALHRRRVGRADAGRAASASAARSRCASAASSASIAAEDAGLYRDAFGAVPPGGLPESFIETVDEPLARVVRRYARTHGPFTTAELTRRYGVDLGPVLRELERAGDLCAASCAPAAASASGATPACCAGCGARRWRRCARRSRPPSRRHTRASCRPGRASTRHRPAAPVSTACARCSCRSRAWRSRPRSGRRTCCRAASAPTRRRGWTS